MPAWREVELIDRRTMPRPRLVQRVVAAARECDALILNGAARYGDLYQDLVAAALVARMRRPPAVVMAETAWDTRSAPLGRVLRRDPVSLAPLVRMAVRALDGPHVRYCVFARDEGTALTELFGIPPERIVHTPCPQTLWSRTEGERGDGGYVFSGGTSLRDWATLVEAVRGLDAPVRVFTRPPIHPDPPANLDVRWVPHDEFVEQLAHAGVVVMPLEPAPRATGLTVYVNAMALGKLVIVSDTTGTCEYVKHRETGIVVPPRDPAALRSALEWALDPANREEVDRIRERARAEVLAERHPADYWQRLRDTAETAALR